ncbi:MAG: SUMF1/EgtB/PvdO family nonheme iron enzyme [Sediminibacterium sp.]|jgi:sulfatase modifying factor 1|nr:SUMF1/EgtB/PvdO family nonheme iron enzyme [Sediminibacterium sp.]
MKQFKWIFFFSLASILTGCGLSSDRGELTGVGGRSAWFHPQPYGTVYIPSGTIHVGSNEQDIPNAMIAPNKQITVVAFYMDETEITNNEYRQFVNEVTDSIFRDRMGEKFQIPIIDPITEEETGEHAINYKVRIEAEDLKNGEINDMYYQGNEVYYRAKQIDVRKLKYRYDYVNLREAALLHKQDAYKRNRADFKKEEVVEIYPDTLVFMRDFTYAYNEPISTMYYWHPKYDDYPVVGVNWKQARAFAHWRTFHLNSYYAENEENGVTSFRLPTEYEWEYAARGGRDQTMYPWGGPYVRNAKGCSLANFKPGRGDYGADGGVYPIRVSSYFPNDFGLYDMSGNVAEWTVTAYAESGHLFSHDLNSDYQYDAKDEDNETLKRKVIRGGSWKDIAHYIQNGTRTYEYQDSANSYTGFRLVQSYVGRSNRDKK